MKHEASNFSWRKSMLWTAALIAALSLAGGCAKKPATPPESAGQTPAAPSQPGQQPSTQPGQGQGQTNEPAKQPAANVKLTPIAYGDAEKQVLTSTAKTVGVKTVYVPQKGAPDDKLDQVQAGGKQMTLAFLKMAVTESPEEIKPAGTPEAQKDVKLKIGAAKWITVGGQPTLYLKLGDTYIAINSAKSVSTDEIEAIAETLTPLK